jgi:hypothetical protein
LFFNYIIKNQSIDKCDISPVNWVYPILTGHIYVLVAILKKIKNTVLFTKRIKINLNIKTIIVVSINLTNKIVEHGKNSRRRL